MFHTLLYCPQHGPARIVANFDTKCMDEYLSVSPYHCVMYKINRQDMKPNETLAKLGGIVANIPGDAVVLRTDDEGRDIDIEEDILARLSVMIKADEKRRLEFFDEMIAMGTVMM